MSIKRNCELKKRQLSIYLIKKNKYEINIDINKINSNIKFKRKIKINTNEQNNK